LFVPLPASAHAKIIELFINIMPRQIMLGSFKNPSRETIINKIIVLIIVSLFVSEATTDAPVLKGVLQCAFNFAQNCLYQTTFSGSQATPDRQIFYTHQQDCQLREGSPAAR